MPPAIALIAAAGSIGAGMAAVGGTMAGFAAAGIGAQLVAGAMIAGGVMTGLGAITGNTKLQKWGGVLSLAGGVAGMASGAWSSAAGSIAGEASVSAREAFRGLEYGAQAAEGAAGGIASGMGNVGQGILQANMNVSDIGIGGASAGSAPPMSPGIIGSAGGAPPMAPGISGGAPGVAPLPTSPSIPSSVNLGSQGGSMNTLTPDVGGAGGWRGSIDDAMTWAQKGNNARLVQAGAGILQAGMGAYGQQEAIKTQIQLQEEAQARARQRLNDSVMGVQVPVYQRRGP